jgi:hypothetical protein
MLRVRYVLSLLGTMIDAKDDHATMVLHFVDDDEGKIRHGPLARVLDNSDVPKLRKLTKAIALGEDTVGNTLSGSRAFIGNVGPDCSDMVERFDSEAHSHSVIPSDAFARPRLPLV